MCLKVPCSYGVSVIGRFAVLMYMSEFCFHVLTAIVGDVSTIYPCNRNHSEHAIGLREEYPRNGRGRVNLLDEGSGSGGYRAGRARVSCVCRCEWDAVSRPRPIM